MAASRYKRVCRLTVCRKTAGERPIGYLARDHASRLGLCDSSSRIQQNSGSCPELLAHLSQGRKKNGNYLPKCLGVIEAELMFSLETSRIRVSVDVAAIIRAIVLLLVLL